MYTRHARWRFAAALTFILGGFLVGCESLPYIVQLAQGHFRSQGEAEPIDDVLASGRLSEEDADKLRLLVKARQFAVETIGLNGGQSYTTFYDTSGAPLAYNLSAARQDALIPKTWSFPIVGEVQNLVFFDEAYLHDTETSLEAAGYDIMTYELDAYSSAGFFVDPVRSPMLRRSTLSLVDTIIHELLHNTVWRPSAPMYNESLATFVGRQGAQEFLLAEFGPDYSWSRTAPLYYADTDAVSAFLSDFYAELEAYYAQPLSSAEKVAGREAVFQAARDRFVNEIQPRLNFPTVFASYGNLPTSNAYMLTHRRYNLDLDVLADVYAATGRDWHAALDVYRAAAGAAGDPFAYLRDWLAKQQP